MQSPHFVLPPWVGLGITFIVCGSAFWKGGREEQAAAGGLLLSLLITVLTRDPNWAGAQWSAFAADVGLLILLTIIACNSVRFWPMFAAAFQLLCVITHVARAIDPGVRAWAYATGQVIFSQWVFFAVGVGVFNTWRRNRQVAAT